MNTLGNLELLLCASPLCHCWRNDDLFLTLTLFLSLCVRYTVYKHSCVSVSVSQWSLEVTFYCVRLSELSQWQRRVGLLCTGDFLYF